MALVAPKDTPEIVEGEPIPEGLSYMVKLAPGSGRVMSTYIYIRTETEFYQIHVPESVTVFVDREKL